MTAGDVKPWDGEAGAASSWKVADLVEAYRTQHPEWPDAKLLEKALEIAAAQEDLLAKADWSDRKFRRDCWLVGEWLEKAY
jgi:hypothetical protein